MQVTAKANGENQMQPEEKSEGNELLMGVADDLIKAVHSKDTKGVHDALQAAHAHCSQDSWTESSLFDADNP